MSALVKWCAPAALPLMLCPYCLALPMLPQFWCSGLMAFTRCSFSGPHKPFWTRTILRLVCGLPEIYLPQCALMRDAGALNNPFNTDEETCGQFEVVRQLLQYQHCSTNVRPRQIQVTGYCARPCCMCSWLLCPCVRSFYCLSGCRCSRTVW